MDATSCPECGAIAEVLWRDVATSTDGPVELAKIQCVARHWFLLPVASLAVGGRNSGAARPRAGATPL
jgi:hypothetical protein